MCWLPKNVRNVFLTAVLVISGWGAQVVPVLAEDIPIDFVPPPRRPPTLFEVMSGKRAVEPDDQVGEVIVPDAQANRPDHDASQDRGHDRANRPTHSWQEIAHASQSSTSK